MAACHIDKTQKLHENVHLCTSFRNSALSLECWTHAKILVSDLTASEAWHPSELEDANLAKCGAVVAEELSLAVHTMTVYKRWNLVKQWPCFWQRWMFIWLSFFLSTSYSRCSLGISRKNFIAALCTDRILRYYCPLHIFPLSAERCV